MLDNSSVESINDVESIQIFINTFLDMRVIELSETTQILILTALKSSPKKQEWEEVKENIQKYWDSSTNRTFYILFDLEHVGIMPQRMIVEWVALFEHNRNVSISQILGCSIRITTTLVRNAVKLFSKLYKPETPVLIFKKFKTSYLSIINNYKYRIQTNTLIPQLGANYVDGQEHNQNDPVILVDAS